MEAAGPRRSLFAQVNDSHANLGPLRRLRRLRPRLTRPLWLRPGYVVLALVVLLLIWYTGAWRLVYVNLTPGTQGGDAAITITTDHSTYLGDEGFAITITNHLPVPIYTHATPRTVDLKIGSAPCAIDLYADRRDATGHWEGYGTLGVGVGEAAVCQAGCSGTQPLHDPQPAPPLLMVFAPGVSYTQRWEPDMDHPTNDPGMYRLVFRYSTDPYAAAITRVGSPDLPAAGTVALSSLSTATSAPVQVVDDGLHHTPFVCTAA